MSSYKNYSTVLKLGLSATAIEAEIFGKNGVLQTASANAENLRRQEDEQNAKAVENVINAAIKAKKITTDKREHFVRLGKTSGVEVLNSTHGMLTPAVKPTDVIKESSANFNGNDKKFSELIEAERIALRRDDRKVYVNLFKSEYGFANIG